MRVNGEAHCLSRAVDHEGEALDAFVSKRRDRKAALIFRKRILNWYGKPRAIVTDNLASYRAAMRELGNAKTQETGR